MSDTLAGVAVVAHGGGPTQVINASLAGVIEACRRRSEITALYGARHGILGVIEEHFLDLYRQDGALISAICIYYLWFILILYSYLSYTKHSVVTNQIVFSLKHSFKYL